MSDKILVRLVQGWQAYNSGDVARFERHVAEQLIKKGVAVAHNPNPAPAPVDETPAAPAEADGAEDKAPADEPAPTPAPVEEAPAAPASTKKSSTKK